MRIRREGTNILLLVDGRLVTTMPWQAALDISRALQRQAREAEESAGAEQLIFDQAILTRAGTPVGLTRNKALLKEAAKEAAWNSDLRRYMPGGVKSKEIVSSPTIIQHLPREEQSDGKE